MKKVIFTLLLATLASVCLLILISVRIPFEEAKIPFTLENGLAGVMRISSPQTLRLGDSTDIKLIVDFADDGGKPSDSSLKIKADLQTSQLEVHPTEEITAIIPADGSAFFSWKITPHNEGKLEGTLWCFRISASGPELMLSRDLELNVKTILGMRFRFARWLLIELGVLCLGLAGFTWYRERHN